MNQETSNGEPGRLLPEATCSPLICGALYAAAQTVGEMDTLLELAKRAAVKSQNWEQAAKLRDAQHLLAGRKRDALLHEETVEANDQSSRTAGTKTKP